MSKPLPNMSAPIAAIESTDLTNVVGGQFGSLTGTPFKSTLPTNHEPTVNEAMNNMRHYNQWRGQNPLPESTYANPWAWF